MTKTEFIKEAYECGWTDEMISEVLREAKKNKIREFSVYCPDDFDDYDENECSG